NPGHTPLSSPPADSTSADYALADGDRSARAADGLVQLPGEAFDAFSRRVEGGDDGRVGGLRAIDGDRARVLQRRDVLLQRSQFFCRLRKLIRHGERRHDREPRVADLAELAAQLDDAIVELLGELHQVAFLTVLAGHAELAAVDGDVDLGHVALSHRACVSSTARMLSIAAS